jgi:hypothetical protein
MTQINELKRAFYLSEGVANGDLMDMEYAWLISKVGSFRGSLQDMWNEWFRTNGYGEVNSMDDYNNFLITKGFNQVSIIDDIIAAGGGIASVVGTFYILGLDSARLLGADSAIITFQ